MVKHYTATWMCMHSHKQLEGHWLLVTGTGVGANLNMLQMTNVLSCARVRAHTGREMSAHKETWSARKFSIKKCFCTYFIHVILNIDECW